MSPSPITALQNTPSAFNNSTPICYKPPAPAPPSEQQLPSTTTTAAVDNNANPKQRNVAFGKNFHQLLPSSASKSTSNVYHHQLVLFQHPHLLAKNLQNQRGFSVPNLGFYTHTKQKNCFSLIFFYSFFSFNFIGLIFFFVNVVMTYKYIIARAFSITSRSI